MNFKDKRVSLTLHEVVKRMSGKDRNRADVYFPRIGVIECVSISISPDRRIVINHLSATGYLVSSYEYRQYEKEMVVLRNHVLSYYDAMFLDENQSVYVLDLRSGKVEEGVCKLVTTGNGENMNIQYLDGHTEKLQKENYDDSFVFLSK